MSFQYKGYSGIVEYEPEDEMFHGEVLGLRDMVTFCGSTVETLQKEFRASVDDYLEACEAAGKEPERPFSGKYPLRMQPDLHRQAALAAQGEGDSLNQWIIQAIEDRLAVWQRAPKLKKRAAG